MNTTLTVNGVTITCDAALAPSIVAELCKGSAPTFKAELITIPKKPAIALKKEVTPITPKDARGHQWWDDFKSPDTTVTLKSESVQVKVARGHANEWHDRLRKAGFSWSKKGFWWASLDSKKRAKVAERHIANDAATAGMTKEERRAYWKARNASRKVA